MALWLQVPATLLALAVVLRGMHKVTGRALALIEELRSIPEQLQDLTQQFVRHVAFHENEHWTGEERRSNLGASTTRTRRSKT